MKKYTVIELAEIIRVPRTTINDWLSRYESFIDYRMQGKRKVYTDATVEVLREISELRNRELSSFDIEEKLADRHPMRGEVANQSREASNLPHEENFTPVIRHQVTEMAEMLRNSLNNIDQRIENLESSQRKTGTRANRWYAMTLLMTVLAVIAGIVGAIKIDRAIQANKAIRRQRDETAARLLREEQRLNEKIVRETMLEEQLGQLEKGIEQQGNEFEKRIIELEAIAAKKREAELLRQRNEFAATRLALLKQIDEARDDKNKLELILKQIQQQCYDQSLVIKRLSMPTVTDGKKQIPPEKENQEELPQDK